MLVVFDLMDGPAALGMLLNHTLQGMYMHIDGYETTDGITYPSGAFECTACGHVKLLGERKTAYKISNILLCPTCVLSIRPLCWTEPTKH